MKIIISPAKKMRVDTDTFQANTKPVLLEQTRKIVKVLQEKSFTELQNIWNCSDKLANENFLRMQDIRIENALTPAILAYEGLQYQHMAPVVMSQKSLEYLEKHLYILSGFYGVLKPFDGITPYRLEMQAKLPIGSAKDLYEFWGDTLYKEVSCQGKEQIIVNLASKEYAKCIQKYCTEKDLFLTIEFGELVDGKIKQKGTLAKMARGEMVRYMAENQIEEIEKIKDFRELGFCYRQEFSTDSCFTFVKE